MTSQKFPFQNGTGHCDSIFTCWIQAKLDKNHFMTENIFPGIKVLPSPPPPQHFHSFEAKQEMSYAQFFKTSHFKNNYCNPLGESILLKFCQNVSNR